MRQRAGVRLESEKWDSTNIKNGFHSGFLRKGETSGPPGDLIVHGLLEIRGGANRLGFSQRTKRTYQGKFLE